MNGVNKLKAEVRKVRKAFEKIKHLLPDSFKKFPKGCCGPVSLILNEYLYIKGYGKFKYVCGDKGKGKEKRSHAWLEEGEYIIDITADQFSGCLPVVVTKDRGFYNDFNIKEMKVVRIRDYDLRTRKELNLVLNKIKNNL